jgi:hypothetical protein
MFEVHRTKDQTYTVKVLADHNTEHRVTMEDAYYRKLTNGDILPEELIELSFQFLLERELNDEIFASFDLAMIPIHFPEYEEEIRARIARGIDS